MGVLKTGSASVFKCYKVFFRPKKPKNVKNRVFHHPKGCTRYSITRRGVQGVVIWYLKPPSRKHPSSRTVFHHPKGCTGYSITRRGVQGIPSPEGVYRVVQKAVFYCTGYSITRRGVQGIPSPEGVYWVFHHPKGYRVFHHPKGCTW